MKAWMIIIAVLVIIFIIICLRVVYELHHLKISVYRINSDKIQKGACRRFVFLSDLHLRKYGKENSDLIKLIKENDPEYILIGGDMTVANKKHDEDSLKDLFMKLTCIAPCFYSPGNHERKLMEEKEYGFPERYEELLRSLKEANINYLSNNNFDIDEYICVYGLDVGYDVYDKKNPKDIDVGYINERIKIKDNNKFNILLSHHPKFFEEYVKTGADLILSGHYHGGAIKFGQTGVISPQFKFFQKYSYGTYKKDDATMIVTSGVGTHTINARLFNKPEVVVIEIFR